MFRKFRDDVSPLRLKVGDEINWIYGYKLYGSLGRFEVMVQDGGEGKIKLIESSQDSATWLTTTSGLIATTALTLLTVVF